MLRLLFYFNFTDWYYDIIKVMLSKNVIFIDLLKLISKLFFFLIQPVGLRLQRNIRNFSENWQTTIPSFNWVGESREEIGSSESQRAELDTVCVYLYIILLGRNCSLESWDLILDSWYYDRRRRWRRRMEDIRCGVVEWSMEISTIQSCPNNQIAPLHLHFRWHFSISVEIMIVNMNIAVNSWVESQSPIKSIESQLSSPLLAG